MIGVVALVLALASRRRSRRTPARAKRASLIDDGQPRKAIAALQSVKTDGDAGLQAQVGLLLGVAYYHADDPAKAIELITPVVDRLPADSLARREADQVLGLAGVVVGRFAEAIPRLEATRRWAPGNLELAYALAQAYVQTRRPTAHGRRWPRSTASHPIQRPRTCSSPS